MKTRVLLERAKRNRCDCEASCVGISQQKWDDLMKGHTRANKRMVAEIARMAGVISDEEAAKEKRNPWYNPYNHYKTETHAIYVHSGIAEEIVRAHGNEL